MGGNPTLEIEKGERSSFSYKKGPLPLDLEEGKKGNHELSPPKKVGLYNLGHISSLSLFFLRRLWVFPHIKWEVLVGLKV